MNAKRTPLAVLLSALLLSSGSALAVDPARNGALAGPANRIVGLWATEGAVSPCGSALPPSPIRNTLLFNAGGTVVENPRIPPAGIANAFGVAGINQRGQALGTWSFDQASGQYTLLLRFDWYVDGAYHGYMTIDRTLTISADGNQVIGPVRSTRYSANGTQIGAVCGSAVSDRLS